MMNDFIPSIKVMFCVVADEFDIDQVTRRMGLIPTETRTKDCFPPQSIIAGVASTLWVMEVKEEHCWGVRSLFEEMLDILRGKEVLIKEICDDYSLEVNFEVVIHMKDGDSPEVVLPREVVSFAAAINAEIGFDIYCYE
jgi:hypothetical protein